MPHSLPCVLCCVVFACVCPAAGIPCERFAAGPGHPPCKTNELRWCQTDLAANAYFWPRFIADDMRFGVLDSGVGASHDGFMADVVRTRKWKVRCRLLMAGLLCCVVLFSCGRLSCGCDCERLAHRRQQPPALQTLPLLLVLLHVYFLCCTTLLAPLPCCRLRALLAGAWSTMLPHPSRVPPWRVSGTTQQQGVTLGLVAGKR